MYILKVNFAKAFDMVDWDFSVGSLEGQGFWGKVDRVDQDHLVFIKGILSG